MELLGNEIDKPVFRDKPELDQDSSNPLAALALFFKSPIQLLFVYYPFLDEKFSDLLGHQNTPSGS
jgi:hypothetical protein